MRQSSKHYILGIDSSCDETSAAILDCQTGVMCANIISSQIAMHAPHGGVVPELASRAHMENIATVVQKALDAAQITVTELAQIAVTNRPGLMGCLLVGISFAKALAKQCEIPVMAVDHLKAHLFSSFIGKEISYPFLGLVVSGGHTAFYHVDSVTSCKVIGQTVDDAAGEAFDKAAKLIGLGYPGGPIVDRRAKQGNPKRYPFKIAHVKMGPQYLSFSGLKTAAYQHWLKEKQPSESDINDFCASLQHGIVKNITDKMEYFLTQHDYQTFAMSGGVAMNSELREQVTKICYQNQIKCEIAAPEYCTDNGAMIAHLSHIGGATDETATLAPQASQKMQARKLKHGKTHPKKN